MENTENRLRTTTTTTTTTIQHTQHTITTTGLSTTCDYDSQGLGHARRV